MKSWLLLVLPLVLAGAGQAGPITRDLGLGLVFERVHSLPGDLPTDEAVHGHPCVLDLRYVRGDAAAATALAGWLKFHAAPHTPVLLLANAETGRELLAPFASADAIAGLVILGETNADTATDIPLPVAAAVERRAYEALEKGASVDSLISEKLEKPRNDEARLAREHISDSAMSAETGERPANQGRKQAVALIDVTLQRAVQLHRTLLALKRL